MLKALQLVPAMEQGGVEQYVVQLNRILVKAGWENVVVSRGGKLDAAIEKDGGRVVHQEMKSKNPLTVLPRVARLRRLLKRERPDVVCAHSRVPAWLFVLAAKGLDVKWITYAHGANSISRYSRVMTKGTVVMCPSNFIRTYLMEAYGVSSSRFRVVPHGIDAARFDPAKVDAAFVAAKRREWGIAPDTKVVMSIGRITRIKGFDALIRAMRDLDGKLVIVGGAEKGKEAYFNELRALVGELGMQERVVFAGPQTQMPECLLIADVVVSANTTKPESFGLSMAEALMMGRPVVAKNFGGARDIVRNGVDGVLVETERDFAAAIGKALAMPGGDLRAAARERFDFDIMSRNTLAVYEELAR